MEVAVSHSTPMPYRLEVNLTVSPTQQLGNLRQTREQLVFEWKIHLTNGTSDNANFINFCSGKPLTNGAQVAGGSCNGIGKSWDICQS